MMPPSPCPLIWHRKHPYDVWLQRTNKHLARFSNLEALTQIPTCQVRGDRWGSSCTNFSQFRRRHSSDWFQAFPQGWGATDVIKLLLTPTPVILGSVPMTSQLATYCLVSMKLFHAILCLGFIFFCLLYLNFLLMKSRIGPFGVCIFFPWELIHHCVGSVPTAVNGNYVLWRRMRP